jgi:hypothetical protein
LLGSSFPAKQGWVLGPGASLLGIALRAQSPEGWAWTSAKRCPGPGPIPGGLRLDIRFAVSRPRPNPPLAKQGWLSEPLPTLALERARQSFTPVLQSCFTPVLQISNLKFVSPPSYKFVSPLSYKVVRPPSYKIVRPGGGERPTLCLLCSASQREGLRPVQRGCFAKGGHASWLVEWAKPRSPPAWTWTLSLAKQPGGCFAPQRGGWDLLRFSPLRLG